jgi:hypothetical protein
MTGPVQIEIRAFAFSNTPIFQYSSTQKRSQSLPAKPLNPDVALSTKSSMLNKKSLTLDYLRYIYY